MSRVVIFGAGKIAEVVYYYLTNDSPHKVVAFTVDTAYLVKDRLFDLPVVPFETVETDYPPDVYKMMVAVGYQDLNRLRATKCSEVQRKGYKLISYVSSRATNFGVVEIGDNCLILENNAIQPGACIGNNVFLWSGNHIGHHSTIEDHCYIAGQVVISGSTTIGQYCFVGVNATIGHEITIGEKSLLGAGTLLVKSAAPGSVFIVPDTPKYRLDTPSFLQLTKI